MTLIYPSLAPPKFRAIVTIDELPVDTFLADKLENLAKMIARQDYPAKPRVRFVSIEATQ